MAVMTKEELQWRSSLYDDLAALRDLTEKALEAQNTQAAQVFGQQYHDLLAALDKMGVPQ